MVRERSKHKGRAKAKGKFGGWGASKAGSPVGAEEDEKDADDDRGKNDGIYGIWVSWG